MDAHLGLPSFSSARAINYCIEASLFLVLDRPHNSFGNISRVCHPPSVSGLSCCYLLSHLATALI